MLEQQEQQTKLWTKSFIALTCSALFLFMNLQMLLSSFPAYVKSEFQAGDVMVSLVTSVFALTAIASRFMTAFLMKKVSRNVLLYIGLAIAAVITGIYVFADSIGSLLLMRVGYGIGFGIASTIIPTIVSQIIPSKRMGEGIGYFGLSTSLAMSIGPMIGLNVMKSSGFGTLSIIGTVTLLLAFPILLFSRSLPVEVKKQPNLKSSAKVIKTPFNKQLILPALLNVMLAVTYGGVLSFIALFGESLHLEQVGLFFLFNAITIILIRPISGRVFDKNGPAAVLIPAAVCVVASLTVLSYTTSMPMLVISALLYGLGFGAIQPTLQAWMLRSSTSAQYGMANSMFYNSTDLGVAGGALILGMISAASDYGMMYRYSAGFMVLFLVIYGWVLISKSNKKSTALNQ